MKTDEIYFRASGAGALMVEGRGSVLTELQSQKILDLTYEKTTGLNGKGTKVKWTETKQEELDKLIAKRDAPPQLSDTAKRFIEKMWLQNEKGFYKELTAAPIVKGLFVEQDSLNLLSEVEGEFYAKNTERLCKDNLTGEPDVIFETADGKRIIKDVKSSFDPITFMSGDLSTLYEWQGRIYCYLFDADEFHLHYCLVDCPDFMFEDESYYLRKRLNVIDSEAPEVKPLFDQLRRNMIFSDNPAYTPEERVKTFKVLRDKEIEKKLLEKIPLAIEYYNSIKLNQIEN